MEKIVCACSTCHVVFEDEAVFDSLPEESEDEEDMLGKMLYILFLL
jgi:ferredoxin